MNRMKIFLIGSLLVLCPPLFIGCASAQMPEGLTVSRDGDLAVGWKSTVQNLGEMPAGGNPVRTVFRFHNLGKSPVILEGVYPTCSCTVPSYPKDPIPAGGSGSIEVLLDLHQPGPFSKLVKVRFVGMKETVLLFLEGTVK